jgi:hypothetical protein
MTATDDMIDFDANMMALQQKVAEMRGVRAADGEPDTDIEPRQTRRFYRSYAPPARPAWWARARGMHDDSEDRTALRSAAVRVWILKSDHRDLIVAPRPVVQREQQRAQTITSPPVRRTAGRGRRTSHRVGRSGAGGGAAGGGGDDGDGGGEPPKPPFVAIPNDLLSSADLANRWGVALKTLQNRLSVSPSDFPPIIRLPVVRGPRWWLTDVVDFERAAREPAARRPPPRPRGRPRICKGVRS